MSAAIFFNYYSLIHILWLQSFAALPNFQIFHPLALEIITDVTNQSVRCFNLSLQAAAWMLRRQFKKDS